MAQIKIYSDTSKGCIFFDGSTVDPKFIGTIIASVKSDETDRIVIQRTDKFKADGVTFRTLFRRLNPTRVQNSEGENLVADLGYSVGDVITYINEQANDFQVVTSTSVGAEDTMDFQLDATSTTVLFGNGDKHGVNSIKAVAGEDGLVLIKSYVGDITYYDSIDPANVTVGGVVVSGGLNDIVNTLNELFTVGAFEAVVISDPHSTMVADVGGVDTNGSSVGSNAVDPVGDDILASSSSHYNRCGWLSDDIINQAGEYFTFDIRVTDSMGFGLVDVDGEANYGAGSYGDPAMFCNDSTGNSAAFGYLWSHWYHSGNKGPWTYYGQRTSSSIREGWGNFASSEERVDYIADNPIKMKVGLDANGYMEVSWWDVSESTWRQVQRSSYVITEGTNLKLGIKIYGTRGRLASLPKTHLLAVDAEPVTISDSSITTFRNITGTLADGVVITDGTNDNSGFVSNEVISASGEYFEFTWSSNDSHVGLFSENDYDVATMVADDSAWGNDDYFFWGHRAENNGSFTGMYRSASGSDIGYTNVVSAPAGAYKGRVGFNNQGKPTLWWSTDGINWTVRLVGNSAAPSGDYKFLFVGQEDGANLDSLTKGQLSQAPNMYFRYIESPDGNYQYPLFATEEEANYYDTQEGGSGTSHTHVYVDDPSNTVWYMPDTNSTMTATVLPTSAQTFEGNPIIWTPITSLTNADLVPTAFTDASITVDELSAVNYQLSPVDVGYVTTIGGTPNWSLVDGTTLVGTAPEVTGDNVANPSDTTTVTVYRTNSYGTSSGTLTINITNLTAPVIAPIAGFSHEAASTAMVDDDTLGDGSVVVIDNIIDDGNRFIINKEWLDDYVLPKISSGSGTKAVWIGFKSNSANWSSVGASDFDLAYRFIVDDTSRAANNFRLQVWTLGATTYNVGVGSLSSGLYDYVLINDDVDVKLGSLVASQGHDASSKVWAEASNSDWNWTGGVTGLTAGNKSIYIATEGTDLELSGDEFSEVAEPTAPVVTNDTPWTKALDFSGSNEHAKIVSTSTSASALRMGGKSQVVYAPSDLTRTSNDSNARPWATVVVFRADRHNSNQHIWNSGEGANSDDDNIYLRMSSTGSLHFGWGRDGALNECSLGNVSSTTGWHGVYIAHNGTRLSGTNATAANLANAFSIRKMGSEWSSPFGSLGSELSTSGNWVTTGGRMDRTVLGDFTVGGRGNNRSFHGKVASMIVTTLKINQVMPTDAEIELMIKDPVKWLNDYKVGQYYRHPAQSSNYYNFTLNNLTSAVSTSVWLMGDTSMDSYSNMIRNYVQPTDQNYTKMQLNSMVSNDIQTVNINGLT